MAPAASGPASGCARSSALRDDAGRFDTQGDDLHRIAVGHEAVALAVHVGETRRQRLQGRLGDRSIGHRDAQLVVLAVIAHVDGAGDTRTVDMRYHGQNYELSVAVPDGRSPRRACRRWRRACRRAPPALWLRGRRRSGADRHPARRGDRRRRQGRAPGASRSRTGRGRRHRRAPSGVAGGGGRRRRLSDLCPRRPASGNRFAGPAIVEQMDATTLVPPGWSARVDSYLNLILEAAT